MNLKKFYSLKTDFTIIGLTGRVGAGCSKIAKELSEGLINDESLQQKLIKKGSTIF